ncbi:MAG: M1 family metallopeptidase [Planctomycetota bacterium]
MAVLIGLLIGTHSAHGWQTDSQKTNDAQRQRKLRGENGPERAWWDLQHYDLSIEVFPETRSIKGSNKIRFSAIETGKKMQVDLQLPLSITSATCNGKDLQYVREGNVYWVSLDQAIPNGAEATLEVTYEGQPVVSKNPPWSGGLSWNKDKQGNHFIATSCQGIGASIWWPCKDHGADEPDDGMDIRVTVPKDLTAVANGRLVETLQNEKEKTRTFHWSVTNPINNYAVNMNIGNYVSFSETYQGEGGELDVQYWVLKHQREQALKHFKEAPRTLAAFEHWFGKYPFYEDSYKLVVVPYLGMEHQSSVTYGNGFQNGYRGTDLSGTGVGMKFDFIIVHESGHEWFGNNISMKDAADMWIHESFTNYSENLFVNFHFNKKEAEDYVIGCRKRISNDIPIIGKYGLNQTGSGGDMYYKGGNMLHTLRQVVNDDEKWRQMLRGLNQKFWHQTVTTEQVEGFLAEKSGINLTTFFNQYLRDTRIPVLEYSIKNQTELNYRFTNCVEELSFPVKIMVNGNLTWITPTEQPQSKTFDQAIESVKIDRNFYIDSKATPAGN